MASMEMEVLETERQLSLPVFYCQGLQMPLTYLLYSKMKKECFSWCH